MAVRALETDGVALGVVTVTEEVPTVVRRLAGTGTVMALIVEP